MSEFAKLPFCSVAIDEGKNSREKKLDFVLENPMCAMEPYPYFALTIEDETTNGYLPLLEHDLGNTEWVKKI